MKKNTTIKTALMTAFAYTTIMGIGMIILTQIVGSNYSSPNMPKTIIFFEIIMTLLTIVVAKKYFKKQDLGFGKINKKLALWFVPLFGVLILTWLMTILTISQKEISNNQWFLIALTGVATTMVGFSEEMMFRGIVLGAYLKQNKIIKGLLISSITFGLLHAVNYFGGQDLKTTILQVVISTLIGICFGLLRIWSNNIVLLMIFHWLYDFMVLTNNIFTIKPPEVAVLILAFEYLFVIIGLPILIYRTIKKRKAAR